MTKQTAIGMSIAGVVVAAILGFFIVHTLHEQAATQQQLDDLKKQMAATTAPAASPSAPSAPSNIPAQTVLNTAVTTQDGSAIAKQKAAQEYLTEGFRLLNTRDPASARRAAVIFQEGLDKADNTNIFFYSGLGRSFLLTGEYPRALNAFQQGRKIDPKRAELASGAGWAYWNLKEYFNARRAWEEAIKLDPNSEDAWMALSWIYLAMGEDEKSRQGFVTLLKIDSSRKEWNQGLNMARAPNHNLDQIRTQFRGMPDPAVFQKPSP